MLPLSQPVRGKDGRMISEIVVPRGTVVLGHFQASNSSKELWGEDAGEFRPERWLTPEGLPKKAQEVQGHPYLLTFVDGHRMCLGRGFALAEFKVRGRCARSQCGPSSVVC